MLEMLPETGGRYVGIKATGIWTVADDEALLPMLRDIFEGQSGIRVLIDFEQLKEFEPGAKSAALWFSLSHRFQVERIAFVGDGRWRDEVRRVRDIYKAAKVRRFDFGKRHAGWEWLKSA